MAAAGHGLIERPLQLPELNEKLEDREGDVK
jgi:hypothetical protein